MPCLSTCPDGKHHCAMVHDHGGDHAASGCRWPASRIVKRAEVHATREWRTNRIVGWSVYLFPASHRPERAVRIHERGEELAFNPEGTDYPTHAEALHAALEAVGLTPTNPEKEQS